MSSDHRIFTDVAALGARKAAARQLDGAALREVAQQFEALFTGMLLKSMRAASLGDTLFSSQQSEFYQDMHDQQLSTQLSSGSGLGLADLLVRQFGGDDTPPRPASARGVSAGPVTDPVEKSVANPVAGSHAGPSATQRAAPLQAVDPQDWLPGNAVEFVRDLWPHASKAAHALGVAPHLVIAQAALETGWGRFPIRNADGSNSHNLFGIKAGGSWPGPSASVPTMELEDGALRRRQAAFRVYDSIADSVRDYTKLLGGNGRYRAVLNAGSDVAAFGAALLKGGYATDPAYSGKLADIAGGSTLRRALEALKLDADLPKH